MIRQHRILVVIFSLIFLIVALPAQAQVEVPPQACAISSELLGGQGFTLDGQGFTFDGQGFTFDGQGFTWDGQGFTLDGQGFTFDGQGFVLDGQGFTWDGQGFTWDGQGFTLDGQSVPNFNYANATHIAYEVSEHIAPVSWGTELLGASGIDMDASTLYNTVPSAVIIVDIGYHLNEVKYVFDQIAADAVANGFAPIEVVTIDITQLESDYSELNLENYRVDSMAKAIEFEVDGSANEIVNIDNPAPTSLFGRGINNIVINMSLAFLPCEDKVVLQDGTEIPFNFDDFIDEANNEPPPPQISPVTPIAECIYQIGNRTYARFGYESENTEPVMLAAGGNANRFSPSPQHRDQPAIFESGTHNAVVDIRFSKSSITWELVGPDGVRRTATADETLPDCNLDAPSVLPEPTEPVQPILECVYQAADGSFIASFGYHNYNDHTIYIASGGQANKFKPNPGNRGQVTHFLPGRHEGIFEVPLNGRNLSWTLNSEWVTDTVWDNYPDFPTEITANPVESGDCSGLGNYLVDEGVPENEIVKAIYDLLMADTLADDEDTSPLRRLLIAYLEGSVGQASAYNIVAVASSGNYRPWFATIQNPSGGINQLVEPLSPARWYETIAVSASLGDDAWGSFDEPDVFWQRWFFSHDGDIMARGAGYAYSPSAEVDTFIAGTSFSAPGVSFVLAHYFTFPDACIFQDDGVVQPPVARDYPTDYDNRVLEDSYADSYGIALDTPLWCKVQFNDAPIANPDSYSTDEDIVLNTSLQELPTILNNDIDDNTITLEYVTDAPDNGTLQIFGNGHFIYTPNPDFNGVDSFEYLITDIWDVSATAIVTITVNAVNDAPSFTPGANVAVDEDSGAYSGSAWATNMSAGPPNESAQLVGFIVTNDNNALFSVQPSINQNGELAFTPADDAFGSTTVSVYLMDNGVTDNGGVNASTTAYFTITINPTTDLPEIIIDPIPPIEVNEDGSVDVTVTVIDPDPEPIIVTIPEDGRLTITPNDSGAVITYTPPADFCGTDSFQFTVDDYDEFGVLTPITVTVTVIVICQLDMPIAQNDSFITNEDTGFSGNVLADNGNGADSDPDGDILTVLNPETVVAGHGSLTLSSAGNFSYTPNPDYNGLDSFNYTVWDGTFDENNIPRTATATVLIIVIAVNDAPSFTPGANVVVNEDSGAYIGSEWAANISTGPANESAQLIGFIIENNSNPALFSAQPSIDAGGNLSFTPAPNANGSATVDVTMMDSGGMDNGGVNLSATASLTITVNPVNDAPSFTPSANVVVNEDSGAYIGSEWATNIYTGSADESAQLIGFIIENNSNPALFLVPPSIDASGDLSFTPAPNANGSATVDVTMMDSGGTDNGGVNLSATASLTITVNPVNDAPSFTSGANVVVNEDSGAYIGSEWAKNISTGPADESGQSVWFTITNDNNALFSAQPSIDASGSLSFTPATDANGSATVYVILNDDGGTANGGVNMSVAISFTITVNPVNDAPIANSQPIVTDEDVPAIITLTGSDIDGDALTFAITSNPTNGKLDGTEPNLIYTPTANWSGTDSFKFTVNDGQLTSVEATVTIIVTPVNDPPNCSAIVVSPDAFGPPVNHRMEQVTINFSGIDPDSDVTFMINSIFQDEAVAGSGAGSTDKFDGQIIDESAGIVELRVERDGGGNGRVYTISFTASDGSISCNGMVQVRVDHDAIDDGPDYDSTIYSSTP